MSAIQDEFRARIERDVARIMRHLVGSEMNPAELDGEIVLSIRNGELVKIQFADDTRGTEFTQSLHESVKQVAEKLADGEPIPGMKQRKSKTKAEPEDEPTAEPTDASA